MIVERLKKDIIYLKLAIIQNNIRNKSNSRNKIKLELDLSNYATKPEVKNSVGTGTSDFAKNIDLSSLTSEVYKLYVLTNQKLLLLI